MATMHPKDLGLSTEKAGGATSPTPGERTLFNFFRTAAKPDSSWVVWFEPLLGPDRLEADFLLFHKKLGFVVIEVKDWSIDRIVEADLHHFEIRGQGRRQNPEKQVRSYVYALQDQLVEMGFVVREGAQKGRHSIPIGTMIAFPNVHRADYRSSDGFRLSDVIPEKLLLLADDIDPMSPLASDETGKLLEERLAAVVPFRCPGLSLGHINRLQDGIWPTRGTRIPARKGIGKDELQIHTANLDHMQARVARRLGRGHQILRGAPGTGKSIVIAHRCRFLQEYDSSMERILVVCFNIAASRYLKRLIMEQGVRLGRSGVDVLHLYELCSRITKEEINYAGESSEYYETAIGMALDDLQSGKSAVEHYDAILVDEGQDLGDDMYRLLLEILKPGGDLLIALDTNQNIYRRRSTWKSLGIRASGNTHTLKVAYRNTHEIHRFAEAFLGIRDATPSAQPELLPDAADRHGEPPHLEHCEDYDALLNYVEDDIRGSIDRREYARSEIAIIYDDKVYAESDGPLQFDYAKKEKVRQIRERFEDAGIPVKWISEDTRAKELYDVTTDRVTLISIHSSKGLDFDLVYLLGGNQIAPSKTLSNAELDLFYVGITRAKHRLVIPYCWESEFIVRARKCLKG